jgi:hypothetical protein
MIGEESMEYDLKAMDLEIKAIEERRNADAILAFTYLLRRNVSDIIE